MSKARTQLAAFAALVCAATPSAAFDSLNPPSQGVTFYVSLPFGAPGTKPLPFAAGLMVQGKRQAEAFNVDSRMFNNFLGSGLEAKWVIAGVVAAGAAVAVASKDKSTTQSYQQQQQQQAEQQAIQQQQSQQQNGGSTPPCPVTPVCR